MAGSLSGVGAQQQIPISQATQPGIADNTEVRPTEEEQQPQENTVQAVGTAPADTQNTETGNEDVLAQTAESSAGSAEQTSDQPRGSVVDVLV